MKRILVTLVALSAILTTMTFAEKEKADGEKGPRGRGALLGPQLAEKLNLTTAQKAELEKLQTQFDAERGKVMAGHQDEADKLHADIKAAKKAGDEAKVEATREKLRELGRPVGKLRREYMEQFSAHLTAEQKATLEEARKEFMEKRHERRGEKPPPAE